MINLSQILILFVQINHIGNMSMSTSYEAIKYISNYYVVIQFQSQQLHIYAYQLNVKLYHSFSLETIPQSLKIFKQISQLYLALAQLQDEQFSITANVLKFRIIVGSQLMQQQLQLKEQLMCAQKLIKMQLKKASHEYNVMSKEQLFLLQTYESLQKELQLQQYKSEVLDQDCDQLRDIIQKNQLEQDSIMSKLLKNYNSERELNNAIYGLQQIKRQQSQKFQQIS